MGQTGLVFHRGRGRRRYVPSLPDAEGMITQSDLTGFYKTCQVFSYATITPCSQTLISPTNSLFRIFKLNIRFLFPLLPSSPLARTWALSSIALSHMMEPSTS